MGQVNNTATFKFIVSSVPFTSLWTHDAQVDSWAGFALEKATLLDALHAVPNVVLLSGDRHEFAAVEFNSERKDGHRVLEISTSPLSMFYIPLVRTLRLQSENTVQRSAVVEEKNADGVDVKVEVEVEIPQERVLKYLPLGNHKWCVSRTVESVVVWSVLTRRPQGLPSRSIPGILSPRRRRWRCG